MRKSWSLSLVLLLAMVFALPVEGQIRGVNFRQISLDEGLSQSNVYAIAQDDDGFMWFGTQDGLNKYDGYTFKVYKKRPFDSTSLISSDVHALLKDRAGNLWIGTTRGITMLEKRTRQFVNLTHLLNHSGYMGNVEVKCMLEDNRGAIWLGTANGLVKVTPYEEGASKTVKYRSARFIANEYDLYSLTSNFVFSLFEDKAGNIWVGTGSQVNRLTPKNAAADPDKQKLAFENGKNSQLPIYHQAGKIILSITEDLFGYMWLAPPASGIVRIKPFVPVSGSEQPEIYLANPASELSISNKFISSLLTDQEGSVWIGTYGGGINKVLFNRNGSVNAIEKLQQSPSDYQTASKEPHRRNHILALYQNKKKADGTLWFGTEAGGVLQYNKSKNNFKLYRKNIFSDNSLSDNSIFSLCKDSEGYLWVGTPQGLDRLDTRTGQFVHYKSQPDNSATLSQNHTTALYEDRKGVLWVGTMYGLNRFDRRTNTFQRIFFESSNTYRPDKPTGASNFITAIYEDSNHQLWIGTGSDVKKMDTHSMSYTAYAFDPAMPTSLLGGRVTTIYEDRKGTIWVGTYAGLNQYNPDCDDFTRYANNLKDRNSLSGSIAFSILQDARQDAYWIATDMGLNQLTFRDGKPYFKHYLEEHNLANNFVYAIVQDKPGKLWMSTNLGITVYDPNKNTFINYDVTDGLQSKEFNAGAYHQAKNGELFFGGINGLNSFFPQTLVMNQHVPQVNITAFHKMEKEQNLDSLMATCKTMYLDYDENFFSFEFVALDYVNPRKNQYAYQLEGFDKEWIYCGNRRYASFTNMDPGEYVFKVKGSNDSGVWNDKQIASIHIIVRPPFWLTWWFHLISFVLVLLVVKLIYELRIRSKLKRLIELENIRRVEHDKVRKQTAADFHDEMGNRITRIGILTELIKVHLNGHSGEISDLLSKISENCNTLYNGTRDFIWSINPDNNTFFDVAVRLKDFGDELFDTTKIDFQVVEIADQLKEIKLPMDWSRQLILIFKEALNNTLKHAQCRNVTLGFAIEGKNVLITLTDDGKGYDPTQAKRGNGLINMSARAAKIKGNLCVETAKGEGCKIVFAGVVPESTNVPAWKQQLLEH